MARGPDSRSANVRRRARGHDISYADEVERCYGVGPERGSVDVYRDAHEQLERLLPGAGTLLERLEAWRFITDPTWRAYVITYSAGEDLCEAYVGGDPAKFRKLLTEQVRVTDLIAART